MNTVTVSVALCEILQSPDGTLAAAANGLNSTIECCFTVCSETISKLSIIASCSTVVSLTRPSQKERVW